MWGFFVVGIIIAVFIALRQNELVVTSILAVHLYADWYLGLSFIAHIMIPVVLLIFFLTMSPEYSWVKPGALWLWLLFLLLSLFPAVRGLTLPDGLNYYINILFGSFTTYWLGLNIARNTARMRFLFKLLAGFGTLIALHTIIQTVTGVVLFASSRFDPYLEQAAYYELGTSAVQRAGSFFVNPDASGGFFGMMVFLPLCLFVESASFAEKLVYLAEMLLLWVALLCTYSTGGWLAAGVGLLVFMVWIGRVRYRIQLAFLLAAVVIAMVVFFSPQIDLQIQHAVVPGEASLREAAWQTGIQVVKAFPLTGVGLGRYVYVIRAEPYRVPMQYRPLAHPHNSYIELAALGGLPVLGVFIVLLVFTCWLSIRNWLQGEIQTRILIAGALALVAALSTDSLFVSAWTLPPLAMIGWLILGVASSPLLGRSQKNRRDSVMKGRQASSEVEGAIYV